MKKFTDDPNYYCMAAKGSVDSRHPGMKLLKMLMKKEFKVLDLGCGEGSRLKFLVNKNSGFGIDISSNAVRRAKSKYPNLKIVRGNLYKLPFKNNSFDLAYSAFVIEHLKNPKKMILEAKRILKRGGEFVIIAPNYGAPNRCSPNFKGSRIKKIIGGFVKDFRSLLTKEDNLNWNRVTLSSDKNYFQDSDTQIEPYLGNLIKYLKLLDFKIAMADSCWEEELPQAKFHQKLFRFFASLGIYPFKYWGPHLVVRAIKT